MKWCATIAGSILLLYSSYAGAVLTLQYLSGNAEDSVGGIYVERNAWELKHTLGEFLNYRIAAYDQSGFRLKHEEYILHNLTSDGRGIFTLLDLHPFTGRFRISTGVFLYANSLEYVIAPSVNEVYQYEFVYRPQAIADDLVEYGVLAEDLEPYLPDDMSEQVIILSKHVEINARHIAGHADVRYKRYAPYFGFGWGNRPFSQSGLRYSFDLGWLYQGDPDIDVRLSGMVMDIHPELTVMLNEWVHEQELELQKKLNKYSVTPRFALGISYSFE